MMESSERVSELLQEISDSQRKLLEQNHEMLQLQQQQLQLMTRLMDRSPEHEGAEAGRLSRRGGAMMDRTRNLFLIILFLLVVLLFFVSRALFA
jgi:ABC-type phosphate transport system auxiliary subunit